MIVRIEGVTWWEEHFDGVSLEGMGGGGVDCCTLMPLMAELAQQPARWWAKDTLRVTTATSLSPSSSSSVSGVLGEVCCGCCGCGCGCCGCCRRSMTTVHPAIASSSPPLAMNKVHVNEGSGNDGDEGVVVAVGGGGNGGWLTFTS